MKQHTLIMILLAIVCAAGGFFGGLKYQQSKTPAFGDFDRRFNGQMRNGNTQGNGNRQNMRPANGTILSADANSVTVKLNDGTSSIVIINAQTSINKAAIASASDLVVGERVSVFGTTNQDGSMTATNIQINPVLRGQNGAAQ